MLDEACDPSVPALERLKFLAIFGSNLDEFFMIRVAGLKQQLAGRIASAGETGPDALSPAEQLAAISERAHELVARQRRALLDDVLPTLERSFVRLLGPEVVPVETAAFVADYFEKEVLPVLTPMALDPGHPFPQLRNKSLNLIVRFAAKSGGRFRYGLLPVPSVLLAWWSCPRLRASAGSRCSKTSSRAMRKSCFPIRWWMAAGRFASPATGTSTSTRRRRKICWSPSSARYGGAIGAAPCGCRSPPRPTRTPPRSWNAR